VQPHGPVAEGLEVLAAGLVAHDHRPGEAAVQQRERDRAVGGVVERGLALHDDEAGPARRDLEHERLGLAGHEVARERVDARARIAPDHHAALARGHERGVDAPPAGLPHELDRDRHLARRAVGAADIDDGASHAHALAGREAPARGGPPHVPDAGPSPLGGLQKLGVVADEGVHAARDVEPGAQRLEHLGAVVCRELPALWRDAVVEDLGPVAQGGPEGRHDRYALCDGPQVLGRVRPRL
jgi:hypothetical protein